VVSVGNLCRSCDPFPYRLYEESHLNEFVVIQDLSAVEDEGRFGHFGVDFGVINLLELVPLGADNDGVRALARRVRVFMDRDQFRNALRSVAGDERMLQVVEDLVSIDL